MMSAYISAGVALLSGVAIGFFFAAIISSVRDDDADTGRLNFIGSQPLHISRSGDYIVIFDGDQRQIAIGTNLREAVDLAANRFFTQRIEECSAEEARNA